MAKEQKIPVEGNGKLPEDTVEGNGHNGDVNSYLDQMGAYQEAIDALRAEIDALKERDSLGQAKLKLVNLSFDTPEDRLSELTVIPQNLVFRLVHEICLEAAADPKRDILLIPLSRIRRIAFFKLMRSVRGQHLIRASMLAENELKLQEGEIGETKGW